MSDETYLFVVAIVFAAILIGIYIGIRFLEERHRESFEKWRRRFATYSVPAIIMIMVFIGVYQEQMGLQCGDNGGADWTCALFWFLIPVLMVSASISYSYWRVYRKGRDLLNLAGRDPSTWSKTWKSYSTLKIVVFIVVILVAGYYFLSK